MGWTTFDENSGSHVVPQELSVGSVSRFQVLGYGKAQICDMYKPLDVWRMLCVPDVWYMVKCEFAWWMDVWGCVVELVEEMSASDKLD